MDWFLIMEKHESCLGDIVSTIIKQAVRITAAGRITKKHSFARVMVIDPGPKNVLINFVDSNHV
jgi:hypothetical protein